MGKTGGGATVGKGAGDEMGLGQNSKGKVLDPSKLNVDIISLRTFV